MNGIYDEYPRTPSGCDRGVTLQPGVALATLAHPWLSSMHASGVLKLQRISSDRSGMRLCYK